MKNSRWLLPWIALAAGAASAGQISLQNGAADVSQPSFSVPELTDTITSGSAHGWAIGAAVGQAHEVAWETFSDVNLAGPTELAFTMHHEGGGNFGVGYFRISVTQDDRATFADGLSNGGDTTANWVPVTPLTAVSSNGATMTITATNHTVLVSPGNSSADIYVIRGSAPIAGITGIRLEVLPHPSLPANGPGLHASGNFILTEFCAAFSPPAGQGDDFDDGLVNTNLWAPDVAAPGVMLQEVNQHLALSGTAPASEDLPASRLYTTNVSLEADFFLQVDVNVPNYPGFTGFTAAGIGLTVANAGDLSDTYSVFLFYDGTEGLTMTEILTTDATTDRDNGVDATANAQTVALRWSAATGMFQLYYDADGPANGFRFVPLGAGFNPTNWGLNANSPVRVAITGSIEDGATVNVGDGLYADNFFLIQGPVFIASELFVRATVDFSTQAGVTYLVESADTPGGPYTEIGALIGTGGPTTYNDSRPIAPSRFYRIRQVFPVLD